MIVEKIDGDSDGFVTEVELKAWIKKAQKKYIYENVDRQWKDFDVNNDGMISWEEYRNVTYGTYLGKKGRAWHEHAWAREMQYVQNKCVGYDWFDSCRAFSISFTDWLIYRINSDQGVSRVIN